MNGGFASYVAGELSRRAGEGRGNREFSFGRVVMALRGLVDKHLKAGEGGWLWRLRLA